MVVAKMTLRKKGKTNLSVIEHFKYSCIVFFLNNEIFFSKYNIKYVVIIVLKFADRIAMFECK